MSVRNIFVVLLLALSIAACSNQDSADTQAVDQPAATAEAVQEETATAGESTAQDAATAVENVAETEGLTEAEATADGEISFDEPIEKSAPYDYKYVVGEHYRRLTTAQGTSSSPEKIEVAEMFAYSCQHCYNFDPIVEDWKARLPSDVAFVRIPVGWWDETKPQSMEFLVHARAMYTAQALSIFEEAHEEIFKAIHQERNQLSSREGLAVLFARLGIDNDTFLEAYESFGVQAAALRAKELTTRYGAFSTPLLVVNGKYIVVGPQVKTFGDMLSIADELVERERRGD